MRLLQNRVSAQADRTPDATALVMKNQSLTYEQLETASNRLAHLLVMLGCRPGDRVCLFQPKGIDAVIGMLATLKAGAAYVPIDLDSPAARARRVVAACEPAVVLVEPKAARLLEAVLAGGPPAPRIVDVSRDGLEVPGLTSVCDRTALDGMPATPPEVRAAEQDPAHILFTSGSTGMPKGVVITHRNVTTFLDWACDYFGVAPGEQISGHPPLHFDLSTFDIYGTLCRGATLHMVPPELNLLAPKVAQFMRDTGLNQWFSVPSILTYLASFDAVEHGDFPQLKRLLWCGEVLPVPTLRYWMERLPHVTFTNLYGPTEATIASSYYTVSRPLAAKLQDIPIGVACGGEELRVLDAALAPVAPGTVGELYIGGAGLSPGYWQDPQQTRAAFIPDPQARHPDDRLYRTGDLGWRGHDGLLHFVGRADSQIKSRGYRIEPGEIEAALMALGYVRECAVVGVETDGFESWSICCAYVLAEPAELAPATLRHDLTSSIPRYMLPAHWKPYRSLPKNANGKIDRPAIREQFAALLRDQNPKEDHTQRRAAAEP
jgi:amino acid adenylation domain-containing protein